MLTRQQKQEQVASLKRVIERAHALLLVDYRGLTVSDANDLRSRLRQTGDGTVQYRVAKNNLLRRAIEGTDVAPLESLLVGPTAIAIAYDEPAALAKTLVEYAKENELLEIKGGVVEGELLDVEAIRALAPRHPLLRWIQRSVTPAARGLHPNQCSAGRVPCPP